MKIILCYPPQKIYQGYGQDTRWLPIGIASIGAFLKKNNPDLDIVLLDLFNDNFDKAMQKIIIEIKENKTNIIGFTLMTEQRFSVFDLCKNLKEYNKKIVTVVGGSHAFIMTDQIAGNYKFIDHIIRGEGENSFNYLINAYINKQKNIERILHFNNIYDLSLIPHAVDGFDLFRELPKFDEAPIIFGRGCTDYCTFCSTTKFWKGYRSRRAQHVFNEMVIYLQKYNIKYFKFHDDACTVNIEELKILCRLIIDQEFNKIWQFEMTARADQFDNELIELLKKAGCKQIAIGIESGNEELRRSMNKKLDINLAKKNIAKLKEVGIKVGLLLIIGYPGENDKTNQDTIEFIRETKPDITYKQPLMIFPGTKVYNTLVEEGWINDNYWLIDQPQPYYTKEVGWNKINFWTNRINRAMRQINIMLAVPARQQEEKFKFHIESIKNLEIPEHINFSRYYLLHNSENLRKFLDKSFTIQSLQTNETYNDKDEKTHQWRYDNLARITKMKNHIVQVAFMNNMDYIFWVDSDLILHPETLKQLLKCNKHIVSEIFWTDWNNTGQFQPNSWDFDHYSFLPDTQEKYKQKGLYKCGGTGACILVDMEVYKKGINYNPIENISFWGEDRAFSIKAYAYGFDIWIDTHFPCTHLYRDSDIKKYIEDIK